MTRTQIKWAVSELRATLHFQWGEGSTPYRRDNALLKKLAGMAYKTASHEARMLALDATVEAHAEVMDRFWKQRARGLRAKNHEIQCLREEIRRLRPTLQDCIAGKALAEQKTRETH